MDDAASYWQNNWCCVSPSSMFVCVCMYVCMYVYCLCFIVADSLGLVVHYCHSYFVNW